MIRLAIAVLTGLLAWFLGLGSWVSLPQLLPETAVLFTAVFLAALALFGIPAVGRFRARDRARWSNVVSTLLLSAAAVAVAVTALFAWRAEEILNTRSGGSCGVGNFIRGVDGVCVPVSTPIAREPQPAPTSHPAPSLPPRR
jgi:hypothetical protein